MKRDWRRQLLDQVEQRNRDAGDDFWPWSPWPNKLPLRLFNRVQEIVVLYENNRHRFDALDMATIVAQLAYDVGRKMR